MKFASPIAGFLTIILLVALPVGGNPNLGVGSKATYNLKSTISFPPIVCGASSGPMMQSGLTMCPYSTTILGGINSTGTIGWTATGLDSTTAVLNVTRDLTISHDGLTTPSFHDTGSFNESINLATRVISIMPFLRTEMDAVLQSVETSISAALPTGVNPSLAISTIEPTIEPRAVYTMWWVNGSLHQGEKVPVLVFPTNVTGSTSINLGELGTRNAWTLVYNETEPFPQPLMSTASTSYPVWIFRFERVFTFNYDQKSGLLLSATADIHTGFELIEPRCNTSTTSTTIMCPASYATVAPIAWCGFDLDASLTLASTNLNLDKTTPSTSTGGNTGGSNPSSSDGPGGSGNPGPNPGGSSGGSPGPSGGSGPNNNGGTSSGSSSQPASSSHPPTSSLLYLIVGLVAVAIVVASILFVRRRNGQSQPKTQG